MLASRTRVFSGYFASITGLLLLALPATGQNVISVSPDGVWTLLDGVPPEHVAAEPWVRPDIFQPALLNHAALEAILAQAPLEDTPEAVDSLLTLTLPLPDGSFGRFTVVESPIMEPELAAKFPEIKTYLGQGIDEPAASVRFDWTPAGFHAQILAPDGAVYLDPYTRGDTFLYASYFKGNLRNMHDFACQVVDLGTALPNLGGIASSGGTRYQYRLACAATGEYTAFHGGTVNAGMAAITTAINRVTGVYEVECCVRMVLVANNNLIVYTNAGSDPYTNNDGGTMLSQNQSNLTSVIGSANYDIGHVFSTGGGGIAGLGVVCKASNKAWGVTGLGSPTGDAFYIDYVAHEMGHQFGANHSFNGTGGSCNGNRSSTAAYEPGSGSTIMSYAGICGSDNLQAHSDAYFIHKSYDEILAYVQSGSGGGACDAPTSTGNGVPTVDAGANYTIPQNTPFILTASGSDPNGDAITYCWEERDLGPAQALSGADNGSSPIFRSFNPTTSTQRIFPKLSALLNNQNSVGEKLPITNRTLNFRCTIRDNRAGSGGVNADNMTVTVVTSAGPFQVTSPNTNVTWSGTQTVTWNVANTNVAPVSAALVNIRLSTDGGNTWPVLLVGNTPNDGSQVVVLPDTPTSTARIKVEAAGNIFFDISNSNFTIPISPPSNVQATPPNVCAGQLSLLSGTVPAGHTIDWYTGSCGGTLVGLGTTTLPVFPTVTTTYYARTRNLSNGQTSLCATVIVTVDPNPVAPGAANVNRNNLCPNDAGTISLTATGGSGTTLAWYTGSCGGTLIGTGTPLVIASPDATTTYYARWESACGASNCANVTVTVLPGLQITQSPLDKTVKPGRPVTFNVTANGAGTLTYQWRKDNVAIPGATNASYAIPSVTVAHAGEYDVVVTDACGSLPSAAATLTVLPNSQGQRKDSTGEAQLPPP